MDSSIILVMESRAMAIKVSSYEWNLWNPHGSHQMKSNRSGDVAGTWTWIHRTYYGFVYNCIKDYDCFNLNQCNDITKYRNHFLEAKQRFEDLGKIVVEELDAIMFPIESNKDILIGLRSARISWIFVPTSSRSYNEDHVQWKNASLDQHPWLVKYMVLSAISPRTDCYSLFWLRWEQSELSLVPYNEARIRDSHCGFITRSNSEKE
jgi:hypothetical protein